MKDDGRKHNNNDDNDNDDDDDGRKRNGDDDDEDRKDAKVKRKLRRFQQLNTIHCHRLCIRVIVCCGACLYV